jgi:serine phosphatase RsbU (regulator of sigma subunit)
MGRLRKKGELFAKHRLSDLLQRSRALSGDRLLDKVVDQVKPLTGCHDRKDDLSAILW